MIPKELQKHIDDVCSGKTCINEKPMTYPFVEFHGSMEVGVYCCVTGNKIKGFVVLDDFQEKQRIGDTLVIRERVAISALSNYIEIKMLMDDGSFHITSLCKSAVNNLKQADLEAIYHTDLAQAIADEKAGRGSVPWGSWKNRKPVRIFQVGPVLV